MSEEQIARVKECKTQAEVLRLAEEEGVKLTDEQLAAVSGGLCSISAECPICHSKRNVRFDEKCDHGHRFFCDVCEVSFWKPAI